LGQEVPQELYPPKMPEYIMNILMFYDKVKTQWRVFSDSVGKAALIGLDYSSVFKTAEIYGVELNEFNMDVLREIESFIREKQNGK
jgi:phage related hypothetical protein (DUF1799)